MVNPLHIENTEIGRLTQEQLPSVMNLLLRSEAANHQLSSEAVELSLRINDPDGGIDALVHAMNASSRWLPPGLSVWQFKATKSLTKAQIGEEVKKPGVRAAMEKGATYCLVLGSDTIPSKYDRMKQQLADAISSSYPEAKFRFLAAGQIAEWASNHPVMALEFDHPIGDIVPLNLMPLRQRQHTIPFEPDSARKSIIAGVQERFGNEDGPIHLRIQGSPGVGKTRLALEIFRAYDDVILYASEPTVAPLLTWMIYQPNVRATIVVDECDWPEAMRIFDRAQLAERRVRVLTIGSARNLADGPETYSLPPMDEDTMRRVVQDAASPLSPEQIRWVARVSHGYVKLATVLAIQVAKGSTSVTRLTSTQDVLGILEKLLPNERHQRAMRGLALLTRVGWDGEVDAEGRIIAEFIGMSWQEMRDVIAEVVDLGLVSKQGRYRYVSPEILAMWLAAALWRTRTEDLRGLLNRLPSAAARDAMTERLTGLAGSEEVAEVVESFLGPSGPFDDLAVLNDGRISKLFSMLATGHPSAALASLQRLFATATNADLESLIAGRRYLVWALEHLARRKETFFVAARMLLRLAEAETETFSNNATGVWTSLFLTHLGATEVPALERYPLIETTLDSAVPQTRLLAVAAIGTALSIHEVGMSMDELGAGHVPIQRWQPATWEEDHTCRRAALQLLDLALHDPSENVKDKAHNTLLTAAPGLVTIGLAEEVITQLERLQVDNDQHRRAEWDTVQRILRFEAEHLSGDQRQRFSELASRLYGSSFHDRLLRYAGRETIVDALLVDADERKVPRDILAKLAEEALANPELLRGELNWLASRDAENVWFFGHRLGFLDERHIWFPKLVAVSQGADIYLLLSSYLQGRADAGDIEWRENVLDEWARDEQKIPMIVDATWRGKTNERDLTRLLALVDQGWLDPRRLAVLVYGGWVLALSDKELANLLKRLLKDEHIEALEAGLALLTQWVGEHAKTLTHELEHIAWQLMERANGEGSSMLSYYWEQIGRILLAHDLARVVSLLLTTVEHENVPFNDERMNLLRDALQDDPVTTWEVLGDRLVKSQQVAVTLEWWGQESGAMELLDVDQLMTWCRVEPEQRSTVLAQILKPRAELSPLIRRLLMEFGPASEAARGLAANFQSGTWHGSLVERERDQLNIAQHWLQDTEANVRAWATQIVRSIEERLPLYKQWEDEGIS